MRKLFGATGILWMSIFMAGVAEADVIATRIRTADFVVPVGACPGVGCPMVPLNNASSTNMPFVTTVDNQRIVVTYSAECTVTANSTATWVALSIRVDGVLAGPSSTDRAHCTSNNNGANWVSAVATAVHLVPEPGIHNLTIQAQILNGVAGNTARLDDSSTVIEK